MLIACWSAKGGSGTTVVVSALGLLRAAGAPALIVDLAGDVPAVLGLANGHAPGVNDWLNAGIDVPADALARLEVEAAEGLRLIPRGSPLKPDAATRAKVLASVLAADTRTVVVDCGPGTSDVERAMVSVAHQRLVVTRGCYLALRRLAETPMRPTGVVLVSEPGRALGRRDVEHVAGVPVVAEVAFDPSVSRAVDAGLLAVRLPAVLSRSLERDAA
jgi:MinD-like ATPase involved in chromosome partitioning or flagellar assembly